MSSFANNAGSYRNRSLGASAKCQNISYKVSSVENGPSIFCTLCALPYNAKIRLNPCFHVLCSKCYELSAQQQSCPLCNAEINDVEFLFIGENIFVCPYDDCKKGFLNLKCFHYHIHFKHQFLKSTGRYTEDGSGSISDHQKTRGDVFPPASSDPFSTSFFANSDGDDQEYNHDAGKNDPSGNSSIISMSRAIGVNASRGGALPPLAMETPFNVYNNVHSNPINNFAADSRKLSLQNMVLGGGAISTSEKNTSSGSFSTSMPFTGKWDYSNVPFKSDFNAFNVPPSSDPPPSNNPLGPSGKENPEDDYDNLEDLM
ncbi:hypothetical protein C922_03860 [Plasmodium inui San Antonio 1]|uniref:RING-type domain-containing protein n=1 Tax=Plasmodium inui San Antonio 1 TaxID=1237626 RepID=W7A8Z9_9APIC|nr:hypothetical protein C922_03860 [Plasmodium inui San Antonio 1]EUD65614.1 hypothetical protein C922_03860 [Plasmodium inui San Antonio 1]